MKDLETLKSLLNKLTAVRVTLSDEEQALLDQLILGSPAEAEAHRLFVYGKDEKLFRAEDEVQAHARPAFSGKDEKLFRAEDEVQAHARPAFSGKDELARWGAEDEVQAHARPAFSGKDERPVAFGADEVQAHARPALAGKDERTLAYQADEVQAHARPFLLNADEMRPSGADEVQAHTMPVGIYKGPTPIAPQWVEIYYDPFGDEYRLKP